MNLIKTQIFYLYIQLKVSNGVVNFMILSLLKEIFSMVINVTKNTEIIINSNINNKQSNKSQNH